MQKTSESLEPAEINFETIFQADDSIRFIGVCNTQGQLLDAQYRNGIKPLLNDSGLQLSAMKASIKHSMRLGESAFLGKPLYSTTVYQNVKRTTIPIDDELLFLISFEKNADEHQVIPKLLDSIVVG